MKEKAETVLFEAEVRKRKIEYLLHFTPFKNLFSIFEQGSILSRYKLENLSSESPSLDLWDYVSINDKMRLDKLPNYVNTSIQNINYILLQRYRKRLANESPTWCVVVLQKELIWLEYTLFSVGNAASSSSKYMGIDGSFNTFLKMFESGNTGDKMEVNDAGHGLSNGRNQTIDIQAEVLIKDEVPMSYIQRICFETESDKLTALGAARMVVEGPLPKFDVDPSMFQMRI